MSWWDSYKARFADNVRHGPSDGLHAIISSNKHSQQIAQERREAQQERTVVDLATLNAFLTEKQAVYDAQVAAERARGNRNYPDITLEVSRLGEHLAVVRYNRNGQRGMVEVFYGGAGSNPLDTPDGDYHGHVVIINGTIDSWLEPGPRHQRNKLY